MSRSARGRARGQALAMFSLTLLLVAVMVCLTLGIGMKAREKVELQMLADAAAYSNAVVTARTFNSISLLNRVAVAHMVNSVSTQTLVAYGSAYRVALKGLQVNIDQRAQNNCAAPDPTCDWCTRWNTINAAALAEITRIDAGWDANDIPTRFHLQALQGAASGIAGLQTALHVSLMGHLTGQALAAAIAIKGDQGNKWLGEITAPPAAASVSVREAGGIAICDVNANQAVCLPGPSQEPGIQATLGSRFYALSTSMANLGRAIEDTIETKLALPRPENEVRMDPFDGSARLADIVDPHSRPGEEGLAGEAHGRIRAQVFLNLLCGTQQTPPARFETFVFSSSIFNFNDTHTFDWDGIGATGPQNITEVRPQHAYGPCYDIFGNPIACGMYPAFVDLNPGHVEPGNTWSHLFGQPKNIAVLERDYARRCALAAGPNCAEVDPWNLFFTMQIRQGATVEELNNKGLITGPPGNVDISRQVAVAAGLAYYHRMNHWREPPNFFNPYWRATLVSPGIDRQGHPILGGQDIQTVLGTNTFAVDAVNRLAAQGFRGWQ